MEKAIAQFKAGQFTEAYESLNAVLEKTPNNDEALLLRSTLNTRRSKLDIALEDAERAVVVTQGSPESQLRRAVCLWRLKRVGEAKSLVKYFGQAKEAEMWKTLLEQSKEVRVDIPRIPELSNASTGSEESVEAAANTPKTAPAAPRIDWYQSQSTINLTVYRKHLDSKSTQIKIEDRRLSVVSQPDEFEWTCSLGNDIIPSESSFDLTAFKVEFILKKKELGTWSSLESKGSTEPRISAPVSADRFSAPTTSYRKWELIDDEDGPEESEGDPMRFFQQLYKDAPPETQRAMMKSYIESNGTALSTNWDEVSKGKVPTQPPKDMEAREWE